MNTNHLSGKTAKRMTKATMETFIGNRGNCLISLPLTQLYEWIELLKKEGINSKEIVLEEMEKEIMNEKNKN